MFENEKNYYKFTGKPAQLNTAVLLLFFNRPEQFFQVFEQVAIVRPNRLFLYQDGARSGKNDLEGICECRKILDKIDWECEVYTWFREENQGCDPSEYLSQKWAFSIVDKCIILEDDDVPSQSFFYFCQELLDKYEDDERINIISGMNTLGQYNEKDADYFYTTMCSIWGWASWRRVIEKWDEKYEFLTDKKAVDNMMKLKELTQTEVLLKASRNHQASGIPYYETILATDMFLNHRINIVPSKNLIKNIGIAATSTHSTDSIDKLPRGIRRVFNMDVYEMDFPLRHPKYMMEDIDYQKKVKRIMGWGHPGVGYWRAIESKWFKFKSKFKK
jgi:hypothetical protein